MPTHKDNTNRKPGQHGHDMEKRTTYKNPKFYGVYHTLLPSQPAPFPPPHPPSQPPPFPPPHPPSQPPPFPPPHPPSQPPQYPLQQPLCQPLWQPLWRPRWHPHQHPSSTYLPYRNGFIPEEFVSNAIVPLPFYEQSLPSAPKNVALTSHQFMQQRGLLVDELQHLPLNTPWPSHFIPPSEFKIQPTIEPHYPSLKSDQQTSKTFQDMKSNQYDDEDVNEILIFFENIKEDEWMNLLQDKVSRFTCEETIKTVVKVEELKEIKDRGIEIEIDKSKKIKEGVRKRLKKIKIQNPEGIEIDLRINNKEEKKQEYYNMSRNHKDKYENSNPRRMYTLMCPEDYQSGKKSHWSELEITGSIRNLSPNLWQMTHLTALYLNDNSLQRVPSEIGRLVNLRILDLSSNKLRSLPAELGELIYLRELLLNQNYLRVLPYELGKLFQLQVLGLQGNPLSKDVMTLYGNGEPAGTNKLLTYMLDNLQVTANHPPQRPWIPLTRPNRTRPTCIFTVMCYNVLCDKYATRQMYGYCPSWALDWEYRKKGILDEIRHYAADIISLQEVETDQFYNFFLPELKHDGYDGIFSPKSRAKTMAENDRKYVDGCAIFYRTAKFSLIKEHLVEFNQLAMANAEGSDNMLNRVMPKDNIGLAALLRTKEAAWDNGVPSDPAQVQQPILVCTAHIHWDPEFCDVKLIQTMMLSNELRSILDQAGQSFRPGHKPDSSNVQLLLCGDFNSLPDSGVIEFLTSGRVAADHRDFKDLAYKSCLQKISGCDKPNEFTHSFKLASAYSEDIMPYTNYTFEFKGIIDYIFYSKQSMVPLGLLGPLSPEWFKEHKVVGCPHPHVPSDHFPLLVELEMTPTVGTSNGLISRR